MGRKDDDISSSSEDEFAKRAAQAAVDGAHRSASKSELSIAPSVYDAVAAFPFVFMHHACTRAPLSCERSPLKCFRRRRCCVCVKERRKVSSPLQAQALGIGWQGVREDGERRRWRRASRRQGRKPAPAATVPASGGWPARHADAHRGRMLSCSLDGLCPPSLVELGLDCTGCSRRVTVAALESEFDPCRHLRLCTCTSTAS